MSPRWFLCIPLHCSGQSGIIYAAKQIPGKSGELRGPLKRLGGPEGVNGQIGF